MKPLEETIMAAMDCTEKEILPFLPYILQDFWTIGTDPDVVIDLIKKHTSGIPALTVLDLGCGKGAVSVSIAQTLGCTCQGIDAIPDFVAYARTKAEELRVSHLCHFETGDIRKRIESLHKYDVIILGAVGQVLGNYYETLTRLRPHLNPGGIIVIDDGYVDDASRFVHPHVLKRGELLRQMDLAEMMVVEEVEAGEATAEAYEKEYTLLAGRCDELALRHPEKAYLFENYKNQQKKEYANLTSEITCATLVVKQKV